MNSTDLENLYLRMLTGPICELASCFYGDDGLQYHVSWKHLQHPVTGVDYYRVASNGINYDDLRVEWYDSREKSLQSYDEFVMVRRENFLGDNAHPN